MLQGLKLCKELKWFSLFRPEKNWFKGVLLSLFPIRIIPQIIETTVFQVLFKL